MLSGAISPDSGEVLVEGAPVKLHGPIDARHLGIETLYQDLALLPNLDVTTNLFLGREEKVSGPLRLLGVLSRRRMRREAWRHVKDLRIRPPADLRDPRRVALRGPAPERRDRAGDGLGLQARDHGRAHRRPGRGSVRRGLELIERVRARGTSVIIISHILPHILEVADRIVVVRHGKKVGDLPADGVTQDRLIGLIVGSELSALSTPEG